MDRNGNQPRSKEVTGSEASPENALNNEFLSKLRSVRISRRSMLMATAGAVGAAALGSALGGCGGGEATPSAGGTAAATATEAAAGGAAGGEPTGKFIFLSAENYLGTWDPYMHTNLAHERIQPHVLEPLVKQNAAGDLIPGLAESWTQVDDVTVEFKLTENVKFHDGQDFTGEDVKASLEMASDPKKIFSIFTPGKLACEVVDPLTVRVMTENPAASLIPGLPRLMITCKDDVDNPQNWEKKLNGTGPFKWVDYKGEDTGIEMSANMEYRKGPPKIKDVVFRYVGDANTRLAALKSGACTVMDRVEPEQMEPIEGDANLAVLRVPGNEYKWLHIRAKVDPLGSNQKLRQAIAHAIDRESIVKNVLRDAGYMTNSYLYKTQLHYSDTKNFPTYNPEKAKQLLAEAGYPNGEGLRELHYITSVGFYIKTKEYGEVIVDNLKQVGIQCRLDPMEVAAWNSVLYEGEVGDMIDCGWFIACPEQDIHLRSLFYSEGRLNKFSDPEVDAAIDDQVAELDPEKRKEKLNKVSELLSDKVPSFPVLQTQLTTGVSKKLKDFEVFSTSFFDLWPCTLET